jgi:radical SAM-linked protein
MTGQRLRLGYTRDERVKDLSQIDTVRVWESAFKDAGLAVAMSEGRAPRPRIALAAPLSVGMTSEAELLDAILSERVRPAETRSRLNDALAAGFHVLEAKEVGAGLPSLQSQLRWAEYRALVDHRHGRRSLHDVVEAFLARDSLPWEEARETKTKRYDLRAQVDDLWLAGENEEAPPALGMRLRLDSGGSGRPDQVLIALGLEAVAPIHRTALILGGIASPSLLAWRRSGRFQE